MAAKSKTNISKIDKYVKGRLNAHDMHELERETYDDAFLDEAMEGYEQMPDDAHEETIDDLKGILAARVAPAKNRPLLLWRVFSIAASVLLILGAGYWFFKQDTIKTPKVQLSQNIKAKQKDEPKQIAVNKSSTDKTIVKEKKPTANANIKPTSSIEPESVLMDVVISGWPPLIVNKTDTVEYRARDYKVRVNSSVDELLRKAEGFEVDTAGAVLFNGQRVAKARLNGKDYSGGDVAQAIQRLPAEIIDKFQIVDDYGDQAGRTGIRTGDPTKVLNLTTRKDEVRQYTAQLIYKEDTAEFITNNYPIANKAKVFDVINKLPGFKQNGDGLLFEGQQIKEISVNSIGDKGKTMLGITQKLPADVLEKVQVIDDYSDMAGWSGFKSLEPQKALNLVVRDMKNRRLPWAHNLNGVTVPGDTVATPKPAIGWKKYADYVRKNAGTTANKTDELMVFFYVAPDGSLSNIRATGYSNVAQYEKAISIIKDGPAWIGYKEPRQIWLKIKLNR